MKRDQIRKDDSLVARRIALLIEYDGTNFVGWQLQAAGRSVQGELEAAVQRLFGETTRVHGAGRTDSGVHATGQVAHLDLEHPIPVESLRQALNTALAEDLVIREVTEVPNDFDSRRHAVRRWYAYKILHGGSRPAMARFYAAWIPQELDTAAMRAAASRFVGTHDFSAFRSSRCAADSPVRTVEFVDLDASGRMIEFSVAAPSFLMNQVRRMAGTLIEVGRGKIMPAELGRMLEGKGEFPSGPTAPPQGLTLLRVEYPADPFA